MSDRSGSSTGTYLLKLIPAGSPSKTFFANYVIGASDKVVLDVAAKDDSYRYAYNGIVSFLGGLSGLCSDQAAWAVTKMYYSAFYIARASLCRDGQLIFHVPKDAGKGYSQYELKVAEGERASISTIPSTHKLVASRFENAGIPLFMQGVDIDGLAPISWLMEQREFWQYRSGRFPDPDFPRILSQLDTQKLQRFLTAYQEDTVGLYLSDPDHALIAIPFRMITWYLSLASFSSTTLFTSEDMAYLQRISIAGKQKLTALSRFFNI
jgi:hypothetical protein